MPFGNTQLRRSDTDTAYTFGRSFDRRSPVSRRNDQQPAQAARRTAQESGAGYQGQSQTDLSVTTAEGDRITISLAAQVQYAKTQQSGQKGQSQTVASSSASQLRVSVDGHLSDAELKDLGTLLTNLTQARSQPAQAEPVDPSAGLTSVAAFAYRYQESVQAGTYFRLNA